MKDHTRWYRRLVSVLVLTLTLIGSGASQSTSLSGSFGFLLHASIIDSGDGNGGVVLGVLNFDGAGSVTGRYTVRGRGGPDDQATGSLTGTYSSNPDGTGSVKIAFDAGFAGNAGMVIIDGGKGLQFVQSDDVGGGDVSLRGTAQSLTGGLPMGVFVHGATGNVPLSLSGVSNGDAGTTVYTAASATGSGTAQCPNGSAANWTATVPALTVAGFPDVPTLAAKGGRRTSGSFLLALSFKSCGDFGYRFLSGTVSGDVGAGGATSLVLHRFGDVLGGIARAGQTGSLSGAYGFQLDYSPFPAGTAGVMNFDGAGNVAVSLTSAGGIDTSPTPVSSTLNGTYSIKPDGTGTISLKPAAGQSANLTFAFVTTDGGSGLLLLQTSLAARGDVAFGTARLQ